MQIQKRKLKDYIGEFRNISSKNDNEILDYFRKELKDPYVNYDLEKLYYFYKDILKQENVSNKFIEVLGFLVFSVAAERTNIRNSKIKEINSNKINPEEIANFALQRKQTLDFIRTEYEIDGRVRQNPKYVKFHRAGTTSFILYIQFGYDQTENFDQKPLALKILKFRYIDNKTINESTRNYAENYSINYKYMPKIFISNEKYILMEFIEGQTLDEFIESETFRNSVNKDKIIRSIFIKLCNIMKYFANNEIQRIIHKDLNPKNIIIKNYNEIDSEKINEEKVDIVLIDFGVNYLFYEKIGSSRALTRAIVYIADEVLEDYNKASIISDIYSLGVILLEFYNPEYDFNSRDFDSYLYKIRETDPILASILDDILIQNPELRLYDLQKKYGYDPDDLKKYSNIYDDLRRNFELEFKLKELKTEKELSIIANIFFDILNFFTRDIESIVKKRIAEAKEIFKIKVSKKENELDEYNFRRLTRKLGIWSFVSVMSHMFVLLIFSFFTSKYYKLNTLNEYIYGLVVCLTFSFVALKYYLGIFSNLYTKGLEKLGWWTNLWMRFCTFYWPPGILLIYYFNPKYWPYVTFYGTFVVVINNYLCYKLGKKAEHKIEKFLNQNLPLTIKQRLEEYKSWWQLMALYSLGVLVCGILLTKNILVDEKAYAAIVLIVNFKLHRYNNIKLAPGVRNTLQFLYTRYYRVLKYQSLSKNL